jgi:exonuclease V gamma subunit
MSTKPSALSHIFSNLNDIFNLLGNHHNPEEWESNLRTIYASFFKINGETLAPQSGETKDLSILDQERESQFTAFFFSADSIVYADFPVYYKILYMDLF